jgi:hypothetical protein
MCWLLKRWWFWAGAGFMLVAVAAAAGYLLIPVDEGRISQASCDRLQLGWSPHQVASLLRDNVILDFDRVQEPKGGRD